MFRKIFKGLIIFFAIGAAISFILILVFFKGNPYGIDFGGIFGVCASFALTLFIMYGGSNDEIGDYPMRP